ncbi:unnamed protein product, partial [Urochloa humidicola]
TWALSLPSVPTSPAPVPAVLLLPPPLAPTRSPLDPAAPRHAVALPTRRPAARPAPASLRRRHGLRSAVAAGGVAADRAQANPAPRALVKVGATPAAAAEPEKNGCVTLPAAESSSASSCF